MTRKVCLKHSAIESFRDLCRSGGPGYRDEPFPTGNGILISFGACTEYLICAWHRDRHYEGELLWAELCHPLLPAKFLCEVLTPRASECEYIWK